MVMLGGVTTCLAIADGFFDGAQTFGKGQYIFAIRSKQIMGKALCGLRTYARQFAKFLHQSRYYTSLLIHQRTQLCLRFD
jgi:hypothetical protein